LKKKIFLTIVNVIVLCLLVIAVSTYFVFDDFWIGYVLIGLAVICLLSVKVFGIRIRSIKPDIIFGVIDNSILVLLAVFGGHFGGVIGAIIGGAVGNAVTDGIAGIFEGIEIEKIQQEGLLERRTILGTAVGKMAGCLLGAGAILILAYWFGW